jgi:sulfite reductase alpha subunit-like flavoprotein
MVEHKGKTAEEADQHIEELKEAERWVLEVY